MADLGNLPDEVERRADEIGIGPAYEGRFPDVHSIRDWAEEQGGTWIGDAMESEMLSMDGAAWLAAWDAPAPDEWANMTISAETGDDWALDVTLADGENFRIELGSDFVVAWDLLYWAEAEYDVDVEYEIEY